MVEPVPNSASSVSGLGFVESREKALSALEVVALIASGTITVFSVFFTLVSNGYAGTGGTLEPVFGAGEADFVVPVPSGASEVGRSGVVGGREDASSLDEVVSLETSEAVSVFGVSGALIRDSDASSVSILEPSVGAGEADLVGPVPGSTSEIDGFHVVGKGEKAFSLFKVVTFEA